MSAAYRSLGKSLAGLIDLTSRLHLTLKEVYKWSSVGEGMYVLLLTLI